MSSASRKRSESVEGRATRLRTDLSHFADAEQLRNHIQGLQQQLHILENQQIEQQQHAQLEHREQQQYVQFEYQHQWQRAEYEYRQEYRQHEQRMFGETQEQLQQQRVQNESNRHDLGTALNELSMLHQHVFNSDRFHAQQNEWSTAQAMFERLQQQLSSVQTIQQEQLTRELRLRAEHDMQQRSQEQEQQQSVRQLVSMFENQQHQQSQQQQQALSRMLRHEQLQNQDQISQLHERVSAEVAQGQRTAESLHRDN